MKVKENVQFRKLNEINFSELRVSRSKRPVDGDVYATSYFMFYDVAPEDRVKIRKFFKQFTDMVSAEVGCSYPINNPEARRTFFQVSICVPDAKLDLIKE